MLKAAENKAENLHARFSSSRHFPGVKTIISKLHPRQRRNRRDEQHRCLLSDMLQDKLEDFGRPESHGFLEIES